MLNTFFCHNKIARAGHANPLGFAKLKTLDFKNFSFYQEDTPPIKDMNVKSILKKSFNTFYPYNFADSTDLSLIEYGHLVDSKNAIKKLLKRKAIKKVEAIKLYFFQLKYYITTYIKQEILQEDLFKILQNLINNIVKLEPEKTNIVFISKFYKKIINMININDNVNFFNIIQGSRYFTNKKVRFCDEVNPQNNDFINAYEVLRDYLVKIEKIYDDLFKKVSKVEKELTDLKSKKKYIDNLDVVFDDVKNKKYNFSYLFITEEEKFLIISELSNHFKNDSFLKKIIKVFFPRKKWESKNDLIKSILISKNINRLELFFRIQNVIKDIEKNEKSREIIFESSYKKSLKICGKIIEDKLLNIKEFYSDDIANDLVLYNNQKISNIKIATEKIKRVKKKLNKNDFIKKILERSLEKLVESLYNNQDILVKVEVLRLVLEQKFDKNDIFSKKEKEFWLNKFLLLLEFFEKNKDSDCKLKPKMLSSIKLLQKKYEINLYKKTMEVIELKNVKNHVNILLDNFSNGKYNIGIFIKKMKKIKNKEILVKCLKSETPIFKLNKEKNIEKIILMSKIINFEVKSLIIKRLKDENNEILIEIERNKNYLLSSDEGKIYYVNLLNKIMDNSTLSGELVDIKVYIKELICKCFESKDFSLFGKIKIIFKNFLDNNRNAIIFDYRVYIEEFFYISNNILDIFSDVDSFRSFFKTKNFIYIIDMNINKNTEIIMKYFENEMFYYFKELLDTEISFDKRFKNHYFLLKKIAKEYFGFEKENEAIIDCYIHYKL